MIWLLVGVGGALGSMARHGLNHFVSQRILTSSFPLGTFVINVIGSALIGVVAGLLSSGKISMSLQARTFVLVGLFGGFTTFSSFSLDTLTLFETGRQTQALANVFGQVTFSLVGVWLGFRLTSFQ